MPTPAEWVQIASAVGTVAAAFVGWRAARAARASADAANKQIPELRKQVEAGNKQAHAAQQQVELAQQTAHDAAQAVREAMRARADERSPHVIVALGDPEWPPRLDTTQPVFSHERESRLLSGEAITRSSQGMDSYILPEHGDFRLWFKGVGFLVNEGPTAARIRISGGDEVEVITKPDSHKALSDVFASYPVHFAVQVGDVDRHEFLVPPKTAIEFNWAISRTVQDWAEKHDAPHAAGGELQTFVWSYGDAGTLDIITSEFRARPLEPVPGQRDRWSLVLDRTNKIGVVTYPAERTWLFEGNSATE